MADRNQQAKQEFAIAQARAQFARMVSAGQTGLYDDVGMLIKAGHLIIFDAPPNVWRWLVEDVSPDLRPGAQPGAMRLMATVRVPLYLMAGMRIPSVLVVGEQEAVEKQAQEPQAGQQVAGEGGEATGEATEAVDGQGAVGEAGGAGESPADASDAASGVSAGAQVVLTDRE